MRIAWNIVLAFNVVHVFRPTQPKIITSTGGAVSLLGEQHTEIITYKNDYVYQAKAEKSNNIFAC